MAACAGVGRSSCLTIGLTWVLKAAITVRNLITLRPFKWKGLGQYAGHTTLYSFAKKQDPNWTRELPDHLSI